MTFFRKLQPRLRHYPQAQRVPPVGQPALGPLFHPEGAAEEEEVPGRHLAHQLPGDGLHGGLAPRGPRRARHAEGQPGRNTRYSISSPPSFECYIYYLVIQQKTKE